MTLNHFGGIGETMKRVLLISLLLICLFAPINAQAQGTPLGVDIDCDQQTIEINVHPEQNAPVDMTCVVSNTGSLNQKINVDGNVDGNSFSLILSESSFDLAAGEEASFIATLLHRQGLRLSLKITTSLQRLKVLVKSQYRYR